MREAVVAALDSGALGSSDLVWAPGAQSWQPAASVIAATPDPLPVPPGASAYNAPDDRVMRALIPIGRSWWAIASGYLAFFVMIPFVGLAAIATGVLGILAIRKREGLHGMGRAVFGIVMGVLGTGFWVYLLLSM